MDLAEHNGSAFFGVTQNNSIDIALFIAAHVIAASVERMDIAILGKSSAIKQKDQDDTCQGGF